MEGSQPGFDGGLGFEQMSAPDDHANQFNNPSIDNFSANDEINDPLTNAQQQPSTATDGIQDNGGNEFWNQDFGGQNNNIGGGGDPADDPKIQDDAFPDEGMGQVVESKQNKPRVGAGFEFPITPEEEAYVAQVQADLRARIQNLEDKEANEITEKRDKAREELKDWYDDKDRERVTRSKQNKEEEWAFIQTRDEHKKSKNPWEKIVDNVEINANKYLGTRDVTRMRQAMQARKNDIKSQGNDLGL